MVRPKRHFLLQHCRTRIAEFHAHAHETLPPPVARRCYAEFGIVATKIAIGTLSLLWPAFRAPSCIVLARGPLDGLIVEFRRILPLIRAE